MFDRPRNINLPSNPFEVLLSGINSDKIGRKVLLELTVLVYGTTWGTFREFCPQKIKLWLFHLSYGSKNDNTLGQTVEFFFWVEWSDLFQWKWLLQAWSNEYIIRDELYRFVKQSH